MATLMLVSLCAVCTSTSVSAAPDPSPPGKPIAAGTGPSACYLNGSLTMYVSVKGYDGALWYRVFDFAAMGWVGGWTSLGGQLTSSPAAVSPSSGHLDVYVAGTDGAVYERSYSSGAWNAWYKVGGQVAPGTGPGASGWPGREDVFIQGTDGALYQKTWAGASGWSNWANLGGKLTWSPAAVSWGPGRIDVSIRGSDGAVWWKYYQNGWSGWKSLGGQIAPGTGPAASVWRTNDAPAPVGREDVFVDGTNGALYQKTWTATSGWGNWANLGGKLTASPTAAWPMTHITFSIEVYVRNAAGNVCQKEYYSGVWYDWQCGMAGPPCQNNCW